MDTTTIFILFLCIDCFVRKMYNISRKLCTIHSICKSGTIHTNKTLQFKIYILQKEWGIYMKKKLTAILMSLTLTATMISTVAPTTVDAASSSVRINKGSANKVVTYRTDDKKTRYSTTIKINGCTKKSQIKKLKSSNKNIKVTACDGYIKAVYKDKTAKATITCTVKNKKLKTTLTVKKYNKPKTSSDVQDNAQNDTKDANTIKPLDVIPNVTTCDHEWKHVDAIGHEEQVLISDEWSEPIYEIHEICNGCGEDFGNDGNAAADAAILHVTLSDDPNCGSWRSAQVLVDTIHHEAVYETI